MQTTCWRFFASRKGRMVALIVTLVTLAWLLSTTIQRLNRNTTSEPFPMSYFRDKVIDKISTESLINCVELLYSKDDVVPVSATVAGDNARFDEGDPRFHLLNIQVDVLRDHHMSLHYYPASLSEYENALGYINNLMIEKMDVYFSNFAPLIETILARWKSEQKRE